MAFPRRMKDLCPPALLYFIISMIGVVMLIFQNIGNRNHYSLGKFSCRVPNTMIIFIFKIIYILFWTWILNLICKDGYTSISWLLVLFPFILMFVIMGLIMLNR